MTLGTIYDGTLANTGQSQLFSAVVASTQTLFVSLQDATPGVVDELYAQLGTPPTPTNFAYSSTSTTSGNQQVLVSSAAPGTWYFLVYGANVPASSPFTIVATGAPVQLASVSPGYSAYGSPATLTLTGAGFNQATTVDLVPAAGPTTDYAATGVTIDTYDQLTATFNLARCRRGSTRSSSPAPTGRRPSCPARSRSPAPARRTWSRT